MAERIGREKIEREDGYLYYVGSDGFAYKAPMKSNPRGRKAKVTEEKVKRDVGLPVLRRQGRVCSKSQDEQKGQKSNFCISYVRIKGGS